MTAPDDALAALLDVAAIEARAAAATPGAPDDRAWGPHVARWRDSGSLNPYADDLAHAVVEQEQTLALICEDNAMLLAALRTLTAQHAADVAAAVAAERARARRCTIYSERFDGCSMIDALQAARGMIENGEDDEVCEYCHDTGVNAASSKPCRCCEWARVLAADAIAATRGAR